MADAMLSIIIIILALPKIAVRLPYTQRLLRSHSRKRAWIPPGCPYSDRDIAFSVFFRALGDLSIRAKKQGRYCLVPNGIRSVDSADLHVGCDRWLNR